MHEASIADAILRSASAKLSITKDAVNVTEIRVQIGEFRNVDADSLLFAFDNIKDFYDGTSVCKLVIETVPAKAKCQTNQHVYHPDFEHTYCCETCGSGVGEFLAGEEMNIIGIRMETNTQKERINA